jgi:hypothetical protein
MMFFQDSVATPTAAPAIARVHEMLASAVPNIWVMGGLTVGLLVLIFYMMRVPHAYPFRGVVMGFSCLAFLASAGVTGVKIWDRMHQQAQAPADLKAIEQHEADQEPVGALDAYVPAIPGADSMFRHEQPSVGGLPGGTIWDETTAQSIQQVVRYYNDDANHPGWQVEFSAPNGVVLRRMVNSPTGQRETERMRIQAMPNPNHQSPRHTEIEFELTRRLK